ncbi:hypothetical protein [uncultured Alcanivorax sp.]|jgi:hypothetical protein|uniref:hypothetical protein n=1 Tax=uncultured Alcanivorax sp. TaxID=191215 RepID=UPI0025D9E47C|nr:hypothetical protein [uncultured Alcanivorax sp.]
MAKQWSEIRTENPAGPLTGAEVTVAVQGGQTVGLTYQQLKDWVKFKNKLDATADPGVNDDSTAGYEPGSRWLNNAVSPKRWWICTDATAGAAVWDVLSLSEDELGTAALVNTGTGAGDVPLNSDLGTAAYEQANQLPFTSQLKFSGRLTDAEYGINIGGGFENVGAVFTPYNGSTVSDAGQFIHNNSDYGGTAGNMTQAVIDLIEAQGRDSSRLRYGPEFRIAEFLAGGGTNASSSGPFGTKYALIVPDSNDLGLGADNFTTVCFWVAAVDNPVYLDLVSGNMRHWVNGVEPAESTYVLSPADGWVFYRVTEQSNLGYTTRTPRVAASLGDRIRLALPSKFAGFFDPGIYLSPYINSVPL